jgi:Ca-activated chloride channel family protein
MVFSGTAVAVRASNAVVFDNERMGETIMKHTHRFLAPAMAALTVFGIFVPPVRADGFVVPVRPEISVRGHWAVKYHRVSVTVRDQVASVSIDQAFVNTGKGMIEVEYLFPVPPEAALDAMTLIVGGKEYTARLLKADEARKVYEDIVRRKKDPALLEYAGFGLYRTRAFPLEPGKPVRVVVNYRSVCRKDRDLVEVWYPLNTGKFSVRPIEDVEVRVDIRARCDITSVYSPTHQITVSRRGPRHLIARYAQKNALPNRDLVVYYRAADEKVGATLLTYQGRADQNGYFMLLVSPNPRSAGKVVVAKDVAVVLDRSGSMSGKRIVQAKEALNFILKNLNAGDRFNLIVYNDSVEPFFETLVAADKHNLVKAAEWVDGIEAAAGTNIHEALQVAMKTLAAGQTGGSPRPGYLIFLTDGLPTAGNIKEADILADTSRANTCGARLFALGVGYDVNVRLLDKLVGQNHGRSDYVKETEPVEAKAASLYNKIKNPVMTELQLKVAGVRLVETYPRELGDLFDGDQIVSVGRYDHQDARKLPTREAGCNQTQLIIAGMYQGKKRAFEYAVKFRRPGKDMRYQFVEELWAVRRVGFLLDQIQLNGQSKEVVDELVRLSMKHGIMTPYTSFLADETVRLDDAYGLRVRAVEKAALLERNIAGADGQVAAANRQKLNLATIAAQPVGPAGEANLIGHVDVGDYEADKTRTIANVRQVGARTLYRRGRLWRTPEVAEVDLAKDAADIETIDRYSQEYFRLARLNTAGENQVLATQQAGEELLIKLRGQVYRIR